MDRCQARGIGGAALKKKKKKRQLPRLEGEYFGSTATQIIKITKNSGRLVW